MPSPAFRNDRIGVGIQPVDCRIAPPDAIGCGSQVDCPDDTLMRQQRELIEIPTDALQLVKHRFQFFDLIDRFSESRDAEVFSDAHSGFGGDLFNCFPFAVADPKRFLSVAFATCFCQIFITSFLNWFCAFPLHESFLCFLSFSKERKWGAPWRGASAPNKCVWLQPLLAVGVQTLCLPR